MFTLLLSESLFSILILLVEHLIEKNVFILFCFFSFWPKYSLRCSWLQKGSKGLISSARYRTLHACDKLCGMFILWLLPWISQRIAYTDNKIKMSHFLALHFDIFLFKYNQEQQKSGLLVQCLDCSKITHS